MVLREFLTDAIGGKTIFNRKECCYCKAGCKGMDAERCELTDETVVLYEGELMPESEKNEMVLDDKDRKLKELQFKHQCC